MLKETLDSMLGARAEHDLSRKIMESLCEVPGVYGAYDLFIHNYGPENIQASVHVEIDDNLTAVDIQRLTTKLRIRFTRNSPFPLLQ